MGLDQNLYRRGKDGEPIDFATSTFGKTNEEYEYEKDLIYWRKASQIHSWFTDNVMGGFDPNDDTSHPVALSELVTFYDKLVKARLSRDPSIFPPLEGCFFGGSEVDEWYWRTLLDTIDQLHDTIIRIKETIAEGEEDSYPYTYWYESSW